MNRVYLQDPEDKRTWRIDVKHCQQQQELRSKSKSTKHKMFSLKNSECYFEPWSSTCSLDDVYRILHRDYADQKSIKKEGLKAWTTAEDEALRSLLLSQGQIHFLHNKGHSLLTHLSQIVPKSSELAGRSDSELLDRVQTIFPPSSNPTFDIGPPVGGGGGDSHYQHVQHLVSQYSRDSDRRVQIFSTAEYGDLPITRLQELKTVTGDMSSDIIEPEPPAFVPPSFAVSATLGHISSLSSQAYVLDTGTMIEFRKFVAPVFRKTLLPCSPIMPGYEHFWWRSIAATFFIRPNEFTLQRLEALKDDFVFGRGNAATADGAGDGRCISTYVRHGDKGAEMKLVHFDKYAVTAEEIWERGLIEGGKTPLKQRLYFFGTEDGNVIGQTNDWAHAVNSSLTTTNKTHALAHTPINARYLPLLAEVIGALPHRRHEDEYLSYLANLQNILYCQVSICTYLSNFCRVIDELRATVGGKANRYTAEINEETCAKKACIKKNELIPHESWQKFDAMIW